MGRIFECIERGTPLDLVGNRLFAVGLATGSGANGGAVNGASLRNSCAPGSACARHLGAQPPLSDTSSYRNTVWNLTGVLIDELLRPIFSYENSISVD
jgi:hypothetical protein